jgi:hypothetical protein
LKILLLAGSGQQLIVETEESLDLGWFEGFEDVNFGPKGNKQVVISTADAAKARKTVLNIIQQRELNLLSLNQGKKSLEDLFRQFTQ